MPVIQDHPHGMFMRGVRCLPLAASGPAWRAIMAAASGARRIGPGRGARRLAARSTLLMTGAGSMSGCAPGTPGAPLGAPAISLFGAYFPAWLLCAFIGVIGAVLVRVVFIRVGLDDMFPVRLPVYVAVAVIIGLLVSFFGFGR